MATPWLTNPVHDNVVYKETEHEEAEYNKERIKGDTSMSLFVHKSYLDPTERVNIVLVPNEVT